MIKRITTILLALALILQIGFCAGGVSVFADDGSGTETETEAEAETQVRAIVEGTDAVLKTGVNTENARIISIGGYDWFVIGYDGEGAVRDDGTITLFATDLNKTSVFGKWNHEEDQSFLNYYSRSELKEKIDELTSPSGKFTDAEKDSIKSRDFTADGSDDSIRGEDVNGALLWPLSRSEASNLCDAIRILEHGTDQEGWDQSWASNSWWLRSPGTAATDKQPSLVNGYGKIVITDLVNIQYAVRPAFLMYLDNILLTTAASEGKVSGEAGPDAMKKVAKTTTKNWKLTLKDEAHAGFKITKEPFVNEDGAVEFEYSGAATGDNEYISAIIKNKAGEIVSYGRVKACGSDTDASGTATINMTGTEDPEGKICLFNEQCNSEKLTDYSSQLFEYPVPKTEHDWEFTGFTWEGNEAEGYTAATAHYTCNAQEPHKPHSKNVEAEVTDKLFREQTCTEAGITRYTANVSAADTPDKKDRTGYASADLPEPIGQHKWNEATCTMPRVCVYGGETEGEPLGHTWRGWRPDDENNHKHFCSVCGQTETAAHEWDEGEVITPATDTEEGTIRYTCTVCGDTKDEVIPVPSPDPEPDPTPTPDPTPAPDTGSTVSIANAKVVLSASSFAYNGKVRKPAVKTVGGKTLKAGTDYTVKWSKKSSKNVGSYTVTITGKGKYKGTAKATYKINPKGTSIKALKRLRKAVRVNWKRQSKKMAKSRITGYQIQLATNKKFTKNKKTVTVKGYKKASKRVTKLKGGKKYYVRIRTYKTVKGKKYYSKWSRVKTVKTIGPNK